MKGAKGQWKLVKQVAFKAADVNMGITEFAAIGEDGFLVLERSWDQTLGTARKLAYAHGIAAARTSPMSRRCRRAPTRRSSGHG